MIPAAFDYQAPTSVDEAIKLISQLGDRGKVIAGGHSFIPIMKLRLAQPEVLVDIGRIGDLRYVRADGDRIAIGALTTHHDVMTNPTIKEGCALLAETAGHIGDPQVRNRGTLGGSLAHADPAADYPASILALDAEIVAQGPNGRRTIRATEFFTGMLSTALAPDELIVEVRVPRTGQSGVYLKMPNKASHYAVVGVAALPRTNGVAVGITGAGAVPLRATATEQALGGERDEASIARAADLADQGIDFLDDIHGSADYRRAMVKVYTRRAITQAVAKG
jgi:carbon-monoxide dehydrogenase medium subunit